MTQPVVTQFWPIFPTKSDGQEVVNTASKVVRNGPSQEQLDRAPNAKGQCDYYREIGEEEPKHIDWRKKLGGMLLREIGGREHEAKWSQCILYEFPKGYHLYEHIKSKVDGSQKTVKTHSGGGHDRQDAYLYGYPKGPKKRFRSPQQFFPHLLWLCTDETGDYENCTCAICSPMQLEVEKPAPVKQEIRPDLASKENTPIPAQTAFQQTGRHPIVQVPIRRPSNSTAPAIQSPAVRTTTPQSNPGIRPPTVLTPTLLPQPRSLDQQVDGQYGKFLCRTGEVAWFFRDKTKAWGLGLIIRRWVPKDGSSDRAYMMQPLSYPDDTAAPELVTTDQHLKPWLAWSAPNCTYGYLQQHPNLTYDQVDWSALTSGRFGEGIADVDASILAAKKIDTTYTLFERLRTTVNMGSEEKHWNGLFLGAEKIWNGEPVRLRIGSGQDVMVITDIIERSPVPSLSNTPNQPPLQQSKVIVVGDIYAYSTLPAPSPSNPPVPPPSNGFPIRMREDMHWRNALMIPASQQMAYFKLVASQSRLEISEVKGRWYETSIVFVEPFKQAVQKGDGGNGIWMNARGDATGLGKGVGVREENRLGAFTTAIPRNTTLVDGLEAPVGDVQQHHEGHVQGQRQEQAKREPGLGGLELEGQQGDGFALDDFMNLDGMDGGGLPFGEEFTF